MAQSKQHKQHQQGLKDAFPSLIRTLETFEKMKENESSIESENDSDFDAESS